MARAQRNNPNSSAKPVQTGSVNDMKTEAAPPGVRRSGRTRKPRNLDLQDTSVEVEHTQSPKDHKKSPAEQKKSPAQQDNSSAEKREASVEQKQSSIELETSKTQQKKSPTEQKPSTYQRSTYQRKPPTEPKKSSTGPKKSPAEPKKSPTELKESPAEQRSPESRAISEEPRRNAKRKAAPEIFDTPDDDYLLEESLAPIRPDEQAEWDSWIELESDPAFFNVIVRDLGVRDAKIQELFALDEDFLGMLPRPVHGLIFLYQYYEEDSPEATQDSQNIWFANQTTDNACATVAILNIIMNAEGIELGEMLEKFKAESMNLSPPMRGMLLSNHDAIRMVHNSFSRRIDLLNADLQMENEVRESKKKRIKMVHPARKPKAKKRKVPAENAAYHFIAYVPVDGKVWQLNGLDNNPTCLGEYEGDWMFVARPAIEERMSAEILNYNLLALCARPLASIRQKLAANIKAVSMLQVKINENEDWAALNCAEDKPVDGADEAQLAKFGLAKEDLALPRPEQEKLEKKLSKASFGVAEALDLQQQLGQEQKQLAGEYRTEMISEEDDAMKAMARKKDYTSFIHEWITRLGDIEGLLQSLNEEAENS